MSKPSRKAFDCVQTMREIRHKLSAEIVDLSYDELAKWLRAGSYSDPFLKRLAEKAAQETNAADAASRR